MSEIESIHAREILEMRERLNKILATHTRRDLDLIGGVTERDNFMGADAAVQYGLIDTVLGNRAEMAASAKEEAD